MTALVHVRPAEDRHDDTTWTAHCEECRFGSPAFVAPSYAYRWAAQHNTGAEHNVTEEATA